MLLVSSWSKEHPSLDWYGIMDDIIHYIEESPGFSYQPL